MYVHSCLYRKPGNIRKIKPGPEVIKRFFMLNSAKHEILNAKKYKNISRNSAFFQVQTSLECYFLIMNVKMPTTVGILTFISMKNFMLSRVEHDFFYNLGSSKYLVTLVN